MKYVIQKDLDSWPTWRRSTVLWPTWRRSTKHDTERLFMLRGEDFGAATKLTNIIFF